VAIPAERRLHRALKQYNDEPIDEDYLEMYLTREAFEPEEPLERAFAAIHAQLDIELDFLNQKLRRDGLYPGHFNADNSRKVLGIIREVDEIREALAGVGKSLTVAPEYQRVLDDAKGWLLDSGGSAIPKDFPPVKLERYDTIFGLADAAIKLTDRSASVPLTVVGEGAYAIVHKFVDPNYGITFARKKPKQNAEPRDIERFQREYKIMKDLDFPYVLKVYLYDEVENSYTMEFCESTLEEYVKRRNNQPQFGFSARSRIALQFLYGLNYLHWKKVCHRDLSLRNILLRVFSDGAITVKLSDFGLAKPEGSDFTRTETEIRGTFVDPALDKFKDFKPVNDIYTVGVVLSYIFKGVSHLIADSTPLGVIIQKCSHPDPMQRYQTVLEIIAALEDLEIQPIDAPA
jgi:hypothetical protein